MKELSRARSMVTWRTMVGVAVKSAALPSCQRGSTPASRVRDQSRASGFADVASGAEPCSELEGASVGASGEALVEVGRAFVAVEGGAQGVALEFGRGWRQLRERNERNVRRRGRNWRGARHSVGRTPSRVLPTPRAR